MRATKRCEDCREPIASNRVKLCPTCAVERVRRYKRDYERQRYHRPHVKAKARAYYLAHRAERLAYARAYRSQAVTTGGER